MYHYVDGYKLREIAELTGINLKSVAYTISKTRKEIKKQLKEYGIDTI
jgi:DNA-directed RNA polymerase specialized sigma24 family protein